MRLTLLLSFFLSSVNSFSVGPAGKRDLVCYPDHPVIKIFISTTIVTYPVLINTYIAVNTIININGGLTININNAPTQLSTTVTATTTSTVTSTSTVTGLETDLTTDTATPTPFLLLVEPLLLKKRQVAGTFIGPGGQATDDCKAASAFTIESGKLVSNGEIVSTGFNSTRKPFAVSPVTGSISTQFEVSGSVLEWNNDLFYNNQASYCLLNGTVEAIFSSGASPVGCSPVSLNTLPVTSCFGASTTTPLAGTATATSAGTSLPTTFLLQAANAGIEGQYAEIFSANDTVDSLVISFDESITNATIFSIDSAGHLLGPNGSVGNQDPIEEGGLYYPLFLNPPAIIASNPNYTIPICSLADTGLLSCSEVDGRDKLQYCPEAEIIFLDTSIYTNCSAVELYAVDVPVAKRNVQHRKRKPWMKSLRRSRH